MRFAITSFSAIPTASARRNSWNAKAAATYLDQRAEWWISWRGAARDHETFCELASMSRPLNSDALSRFPSILLLLNGGVPIAFVISRVGLENRDRR
jgi:hypothetical protein